MNYLLFPFLFIFSIIDPLMAAEDFNKLRTYLRKATTLEGALKKLPAEYKKNYSLVYFSRATSVSSLEAPRVIMFDKSGRLVIAFNPRSQILEIMDYNSRKKEFEFHEIDYSQKNVPIVRENNRDCLGCHRGGAPLWDLGNIKPGVYGNNGNEHTEVLRKNLHSFLKIASTNSLYQYLELPVQEPETFFRNQNEKLGRLLSKKNSERMAAYLKKKDSSLWKKMIPLFIGSSIGCGDYEAFLPRPVRQELFSALENHYEKKIIPRLIEHKKRVNIQHGMLGGFPSQIRFEKEREALETMFQSYFKETLLDFVAPYYFRLSHINISQDDFYFHDGELGVERLIFILAQENDDLLKEVKLHLPRSARELTQSTFNKSRACELLSELSYRTLKSIVIGK